MLEAFPLTLSDATFASCGGRGLDRGHGGRLPHPRERAEVPGGGGVGGRPWR